MFKGRSIEFFESDNGRLSMTRLLCFLSFFPASYVVISERTEGILGWYLGSFVLGYVGGKAADVFMKDKPPQEITETTTRTVSKAAPVADPIMAKDVTVQAAGDVTVSEDK